MEDKKLQIENGNFTQIVNPLIEELIRVPFKGCELQIAMFIIRKTYGYKKKQDSISLSQFMKGVNRGRPTVVKALANLQLVNMAKLVKHGNAKGQSNIWEINKYVDTWKLVNMAKLVKTKRKPSSAVYTKPSKDGLTHKRKKETNTKENSEQGSQKVFVLEDELNELKTSNRKDYKIIALYLKKKGWQFGNQDQFNEALKRELRPAKTLIGYSGEQIAKAILWCENEYKNIPWTLETIEKRIKDIVLTSKK